MASVAVPRLMTSVKQLTAAELREFKQQFAEWQQRNGGQMEDETGLIEACKARLPKADERRLKRLINKSERGVLTRQEQAEYRSLVRRTERLDLIRLEALAQLARRWGKPVGAVMEAVAWEGGRDETKGHPARPAKAGTRSRR